MWKLEWAGTGWDGLERAGSVRESPGQDKWGSSSTQCSRHLLEKIKEFEWINCVRVMVDYIFWGKIEYGRP